MTIKPSNLILLIICTIVFTACGMLFPILGSTFSPYYAVIAKHIATTNDWVDLMLSGQDWLDKPHLPFWLTATSFKLFGISSFSYILPGFLFNLIGAYYTYHLARIWYNRSTSYLAVVLYLSTLHLMLSSIDIRAEAYLLGQIIPACYYLLRFYHTRLFRYIIAASFFSALALMTKGIFVLVTITSGVICLSLYNRQFRNIIHYKWALYIILTLIFAIPELISLYLQFDLHPEKIVFNTTHVSGIRWFLWDSQFGRFFNTGPIASTNPMPYHWLFFVHTFLWAFLPWWPVFFYRLGTIAINTLKRRQRIEAADVFLFSSFLITFILFSATSFQVDHYTNIIFPFACIMSANTINNLTPNSTSSRWLANTQSILSIIFVLIVLIANYLLFSGIVFVIVSIIALLLLSYIITGLYRHKIFEQIVIAPCLSIIFVFIMAMCLNGIGYSKYDAGYNIANYLNAQQAQKIIAYKLDSMPLKNAEFHSQSREYYYRNNLTNKLTGKWYIITPIENTQQVLLQNATAKVVYQISGCEFGTYLAHLGNLPGLESQLTKYAIIKIDN